MPILAERASIRLLTSIAMATSATTKAKPPEQLWFFLQESMDANSFSQASFTLEEVRKMDIKLNTCLEVTNSHGSPAEFAFYIHSRSMAAAVRLLTDDSIIATYNLYCQHDDVVLIIIRGKNDPSPNTSRAPSHQNSLAARQKASARRGVLATDLFIQPKVRHSSAATDISSLEEITDEDAMVSIRVGENK